MHDEDPLEYAEDFSTLGIFARGEVDTNPDGDLVAFVGSDDDGSTYWEPWDPCENADQADEIIDRIRDRGFDLQIEVGCQPNDQWLATFGSGVVYQGLGPKERIAICRAALKVLDEIDWKGKSRGTTDGRIEIDLHGGVAS